VLARIFEEVNMKVPSSVSVSAFLSSLPNARQILSCYTGRVQVYKYTGPHHFYRAAGKNAVGGLARAYGGEWWADESTLLDIAGKLERAKGWRKNKVTDWV
jgi:hypothetical protein